jgi:hypothetical protein
MNKVLLGNVSSNYVENPDSDSNQGTQTTQGGNATKRNYIDIPESTQDGKDVLIKEGEENIVEEKKTDDTDSTTLKLSLPILVVGSAILFFLLRKKK